MLILNILNFWPSFARRDSQHLAPKRRSGRPLRNVRGTRYGPCELIENWKAGTRIYCTLVHAIRSFWSVYIHSLHFLQLARFSKKSVAFFQERASRKFRRPITFFVTYAGIQQIKVYSRRALCRIWVEGGTTWTPAETPGLFFLFRLCTLRRCPPAEEAETHEVPIRIPQFRYQNHLRAR